MNPEATTELLRKLIESFIDYPRDLEIDYREMHGRVDWRIKGNINDQGKLVGRSAAHIKALRFIVEALGETAGVQHHLRLDDPPPGEREPPSPKRTAPAGYTPTALDDLLRELLGALLTEQPGIYMCRGSEAWTLSIACQRIQDYEKLVSPREGDATGATLLTSLGTLFRAAGHKDGAPIKLDVPGRNIKVSHGA